MTPCVDVGNEDLGGSGTKIGVRRHFWIVFQEVLDGHVKHARDLLKRIALLNAVLDVLVLFVKMKIAVVVPSRIDEHHDLVKAALARRVDVRDAVHALGVIAHDLGDQVGARQRRVVIRRSTFALGDHAAWHGLLNARVGIIVRRVTVAVVVTHALCRAPFVLGEQRLGARQWKTVFVIHIMKTIFFFILYVYICTP